MAAAAEVVLPRPVAALAPVALPAPVASRATAAPPGGPDLAPAAACRRDGPAPTSATPHPGTDRPDDADGRAPDVHTYAGPPAFDAAPAPVDREVDLPAPAAGPVEPEPGLPDWWPSAVDDLGLADAEPGAGRRRRRRRPPGRSPTSPTLAWPDDRQRTSTASDVARRGPADRAEPAWPDLGRPEPFRATPHGRCRDARRTDAAAADPADPRPCHRDAGDPPRRVAARRAAGEPARGRRTRPDARTRPTTSMTGLRPRRPRCTRRPRAAGGRHPARRAAGTGRARPATSGPSARQPAGNRPVPATRLPTRRADRPGRRPASVLHRFEPADESEQPRPDAPWAAADQVGSGDAADARSHRR